MNQYPVLDSSEASQSQVLDDVDDFFDYAAPSLCDATVNAVEKKCINYLSDTDTELKTLSKYTRIKTVLMKYNTNLPSSDPVPRRNLLSDSMCEKLLLLKINRKYCTETDLLENKKWAYGLTRRR